MAVSVMLPPVFAGCVPKDVSKGFSKVFAIIRAFDRSASGAAFPARGAQCPGRRIALPRIAKRRILRSEQRNQIAPKRWSEPPARCFARFRDASSGFETLRSWRSRQMSADNSMIAFVNRNFVRGDNERGRGRPRRPRGQNAASGQTWAAWTGEHIATSASKCSAAEEGPASRRSSVSKVQRLEMLSVSKCSASQRPPGRFPSPPFGRQCASEQTSRRGSPASVPRSRLPAGVDRAAFARIASQIFRANTTAPVRGNRCPRPRPIPAGGPPRGFGAWAMAFDAAA